jgi:hypothetical protein
MTIKVGNSNTGNFALSGLSSTEDERARKREQIEGIANLSKKADADIIARAMAVAELLKAGVATCRDIEEHNQLALEVWRANILAFQTFIKAGVDRSRLDFPFQPPLFTPQVNLRKECLTEATNCTVSVAPPCVSGKLDPGTRIFFHASNEQAALFGPLQPGQGPDGLGALGLGPVAVGALWALGILAGLVVVGGVATLFTNSVLDSLPSSQLSAATTEYNRILAKVGPERVAALSECIKNGGSQSECTRLINEAFPLPKKPEGLLGGVIGTTIKLGGLFLVGSFIYRKIQEQ